MPTVPGETHAGYASLRTVVSILLLSGRMICTLLLLSYKLLVVRLIDTISFACTEECTPRGERRVLLLACGVEQKVEMTKLKA